MKMKLLATILLAGGSMFAQTRFSVDIGVGGYGGGFNPRPPYQFAPHFDNRFNDGDDRHGFAPGFEQDRDRNFDQGRNFNGQDRDQIRGENQSQTRDFGQTQNQNQNRSDRNRSDGQSTREGNGFANGFRDR
jgi:hypothetical protein